MKVGITNMNVNSVDKRIFERKSEDRRGSWSQAFIVLSVYSTPNVIWDLFAKSKIKTLKPTFKAVNPLKILSPREKHFSLTIYLSPNEEFPRDNVFLL